MLYKIQHVTWCESFIDYFFLIQKVFHLTLQMPFKHKLYAQELYINTVRMIALTMESHV